MPFFPLLGNLYYLKLQIELHCGKDHDGVLVEMSGGSGGSGCYGCHLVFTGLHSCVYYVMIYE